MSRWRAPAALFAVLAAVYVATISTDPSPDVFSADFAAWHIAQTGDPVPVIADFPALDHNIIRETWIVETADGREAVGRAPGVIAAGVPAYFLLQPDGLTAVPGGIAASLLVAAAMVFLFLTVRERIGDRSALVAAGVLGLTTPVWTVAADGMWPHTLTVFGILGMAWAASSERWWLVGLFGGVVLWGRLHAALICAVVGLGVALVRRKPAVAVQVGIVSGAMLALMSVWTHWMYGRWNPSAGYRSGDFTGGVGERLTDLANLLGFLVAPDRGLLLWSPLLLVLAPAVVRSWRTLPDWTRVLLVAGAVYLLAQGLLVRFSGGDAFYGYRTSLELVACAAPALALSAPRMGPAARRLFVPVAILQAVIIVPGAFVENLGSPVAEVWHRHSWLFALVHRPSLVVPFAVVTVVLGLLLARIISDRSPSAQDQDLPGLGALVGSGDGVRDVRRRHDRREAVGRDGVDPHAE